MVLDANIQVLAAIENQRPEARENYRRIIFREAKSRTCFFRRYKEVGLVSTPGLDIIKWLTSFVLSRNTGQVLDFIW